MHMRAPLQSLIIQLVYSIPISFNEPPKSLHRKAHLLLLSFPRWSSSEFQDNRQSLMIRWATKCNSEDSYRKINRSWKDLDWKSRIYYIMFISKEFMIIIQLFQHFLLTATLIFAIFPIDVLAIAFYTFIILLPVFITGLYTKNNLITKCLSCIVSLIHNIKPNAHSIRFISLCFFVFNFIIK